MKIETKTNEKNSVHLEKINILDFSGKVIDSIEKPEFLNEKFNEILVKEVVQYQRNKRRSATAATKNRSRVTGSTRKMRKQKKTGSARMGQKRAVHHRGGAVAFGPNFRIYETSINKKKMKKALAAVLSGKLNENRFVILDKMDFENIKTKNFINLSNNISVNDGALFVDIEKNRNLYLSLRNVPFFNFLPLEGLNVLDILKNRFMVISLDAFKKLVQRYQKDEVLNA